MTIHPLGREPRRGCNSQTQLSDWAWACTLKPKSYRKVQEEIITIQILILSLLLNITSDISIKKYMCTILQKMDSYCFRNCFQKIQCKIICSVSLKALHPKLWFYSVPFYSYTKIYSAPQLYFMKSIKTDCNPCKA